MAGQSLLDTASGLNTWGCSQAVRSKACGRHQPASETQTDQKGQPRLEPGDKKSILSLTTAIDSCNEGKFWEENTAGLSKQEAETVHLFLYAPLCLS